MFLRLTRALRPTITKNFSRNTAPLSVNDKLEEFTSSHLLREIEQKSDEGLDKDFVYDVGRAWRSNELRLKSSEDLHKLWYVLVKEKNRLYSDGYHYFNRLTPKQKACLNKVTLSMGRLKGVLGERERIRREYVAWLQKEYYEENKEEIKEEFNSKFFYLCIFFISFFSVMI
jgi:large subunit ribosomal protein L47